MTQNFDPKLMGETAARMSKSYMRDFEVLAKSNGEQFKATVMANVGIQMIVTTLAGVPSEEERMETMFAIMVAIFTNLDIDVSRLEADRVIERAMKKAQAK